MEVEDNPEVVEVEQDEPEQVEQPEPVVAEEPAEPEELQVIIEGEDPEPEPERAPEWVRELRKSHRELQKKVREYEDREKSVAAPTLGRKPELNDDDIDYNTEKYDAALSAWLRQKDKFEAAKREQEKAQEEQQKSWNAKLENYGKAKADLKARDYDDAEAVVQEAMSVTQQGIVLQGAENPALVVYALGKNPKRAKELAAITDPVKFAFAVAKLESQLKVTPKAKPPAPEKTVPTGTASAIGSDSTLERLREEAARTGDMTKVIRYKAQQKAKAK